MEQIHSDNTYQLNIQKKVFSEQVKILYTNLLTSVPANFVAAVIVFFTLYQDQSSIFIWGWFIAALLVSLSRLFSFYCYRKCTKNDKIFLIVLVIGAALSGLIWGTLASVFMPNELMHQMIIIVVIAGVTAGGNQTLNANLIASSVFLVGTITPLCVWIFLQDSLTYRLMGITIVAYFAFMIVTSIRGHKLLRTALFLQYENQALIEKISISNAKLVEYSKTLYEQSVHDALTGLLNRRYLDETLPRELQRVIRENQSLCVAMLDLDFFKSFNDTHGHAAGDAVLRFIGGLMQETFRESDISCRFGGEEFLIVMINTDIASAQVRLERFRNMVKKEQILFQGHFLPPMTMSIGVAEAPKQGIEADDVIRAADKALYYAKESGRDRIECAFI